MKNDRGYSQEVVDAFRGRNVDVKNTEPMQKLREVVAWHLGDPAWADAFIRWANECGVFDFD